MFRRVVAILALVAVIFVSGILFLSKFSLASSDFIELLNYDGNPDNNPSWTHFNCSTSSVSNNIYLILQTPTSSLISPEIYLPDCLSAVLDFQARTYGGEKYNSSTNGTTSDIHLKITSVESEEDIVSRPVEGNTMSSTPSIDLTKYCGKKITLIFASPNATSSKGFGLDNIKIKYQPLISNQPPIANAGEDKEVQVNELVEFDGTASTDTDPGDFIVSWYWDFGTFQLLGATTSYAFNTTGTYQVSLTVVDSQGVSSSPDYLIVNVKDNNQSNSTTTSTTTTSTDTFQVGDILINELLPTPSSENKEWIELYNHTNQPIDLSGWILLNKEGSKYSTTTLSGIIEADDFLVWEDIVGNLNNSGDEIILKDPSGQIISQTTYNSFSSCYDCAWARDELGNYALTITPTPNAINIITPKSLASGSSSGSSSINNQQSLSVSTTIATTTTTTTNQLTTTSTTSTTEKINPLLLIVINEIYPNPQTGEEEFIEFRNLDKQPVDLSGLVITDASKKKFKIASSTILSAGGYAVFFRSQSKIALNNSGLETVSLSYPDGTIIDQVSYNGSRKGKSFSRKDSGEWQWSDIPTPGQENSFAVLTENLPTINLYVNSNNGNKAKIKKVVNKVNKKSSPSMSPIASMSPIEVSLYKVRQLENGSQVKVVGIVSVPPGVLGSQIFYLAGSGIQIYSYNKIFPNLTIGDKVEVIGELSESAGEKRIKISKIEAIKILGHEQPPTPHLISAAEVGEDYEGSLVTIEGEILERKGRNLYLDDGSGNEVNVYLKSNIVLEDLGVKDGDRVKITGIISQNNNGYRLLPRSLQDIEVIKGEVKGDFVASSYNKFGKEYYLSAVVIFLAVIIIWLIYKWPTKKSSN